LGKLVELYLDDLSANGRQDGAARLEWNLPNWPARGILSRERKVGINQRKSLLSSLLESFFLFPSFSIISPSPIVCHSQYLKPSLFETFIIPALQVMNKFNLFQNNPTLSVSPHRVQSSVSLSIFREFISALEGHAINITNTNYTELHRLCAEFGFAELSAKLSEFRPSIDFKEAETRGRIAFLEEKSNQHSHFIAILQNKVTQLSTDFGRLVGEVSALRSA
jgi:hypothetical protein